MVRYYDAHGRTRFSAEVVRRVIGLVADRLPCLTLDRLTIAKQRELVDGLNPGTARRYLGVVRAALERSAAEQEIPHAPRILRVEAEDGPGARPYTLDELKRLLDACTAEHERRLMLLLLTGARPGAVLQLTWDRIKGGVADFHVPGRRKTKKRRGRVPLSGSVQTWLEARRGLGPVIQWNGRPMRSHRMTWARIARRAGVEGSAYGVRKALATWLRQENVPEWEVGALLGHRVSSATTERYAHHRPDYMAGSLAALEALLAAIRPGWLDTAQTVQNAPQVTSGEILRVSNGVDGSRAQVRTGDHFHVKVGVVPANHVVKAANDD